MTMDNIGFKPTMPYDEGVRKHYEVEREWARRILESPKGSQERRRAYEVGYAEVHDIQLSYHGVKIGQDKQEHQFLLCQAALGFPKKAKLLDVGCGYGFLVAKAARVGWEAYGVDVDPDAVDYARSALFDQQVNPAQIFFGEIEDVPAGDFDVIINDQVLEHIHPDSALDFARAAYERLKPGGKFITVTPNGLFGPFDVSKFFVDQGSPAQGFHLKEYNFMELDTLMRTAGFHHLESYLANPKYSFLPDKRSRAIYHQLKLASYPVIEKLHPYWRKPFRKWMAWMAYHMVVAVK